MAANDVTKVLFSAKMVYMRKFPLRKSRVYNRSRVAQGTFNQTNGQIKWDNHSMRLWRTVSFFNNASRRHRKGLCSDGKVHWLDSCGV